MPEISPADISRIRDFETLQPCPIWSLSSGNRLVYRLSQ